MPNNIQKIAIAAYLHDIGKLAERANYEVSKGEYESNAMLYLPYKKEENRYTHGHAVYTAIFIEKFLPHLINAFRGDGEEYLANIAAGHHKPETDSQWIVAIADRISSGFDRNEFENDYNKEISVKDYKKTRLLTIFEGLRVDNEYKTDKLEDYQYRYPLKELSPQSIFPVEDMSVQMVDSEDANREYRELFDSFINEIARLSHKDNISLWFEHFDSLFMIYASHIPAATVGYVIPDVSLYDHCRTTSAIATALYLYHKENDTLTKEAIQDYKPEKFLLVSGDFYGIQDFIFAEGGSTNKASAKLLRGRSFYVSLLSELAAYMICREIGLESTSVILNAAGKFTILAPNTENTRVIIGRIEKEINTWLIDKFFGQVSMGFSTVEASPADFVSRDGGFASLWESLSQAVDRKKYSKFDIINYAGCVHNYLDSFDNNLGICPFCNKRPATMDAKVKDEYACRICADQVFIGENIVKNEQISITDVDAKLDGRKLLEPIFGRYQLAFPTGELEEMAREGKLLKCWNIGISKDGHFARNITAKFINGYVPKYEEEDLDDDRYLAGRKSDRRKEEMIEQIKVEKEANTPKTFAHLAVKSLNFSDVKGKFKGIEALGILKADVDNLGLLFACGIRKERFTISRLATMSRQMNNYFTTYIPYILKTEKNYKDIYTVFSGGDDLFLIGPWNRIIEFAGFLNESFKSYVCRNDNITISAGIALHKPNDPVLTLAETSEHALSMSKSNGRNRIALFGATAKWADFSELEEVKATILKWLNSGTINNAMLFRLNEFIEMRRREEEIKNGNVHLEDMECLKWRSRLKYTVVRNIGKWLKGEEKQKTIDEVMEKVANWLERYKGALKMSLWQIIYNNRKGG